MNRSARSTDRRTRRSVACLALAALTGLGLAGCGSPDDEADAAAGTAPVAAEVNQEARALLPAELVDRGTLRMTADFQYAPFTFLEDGEYAGMDYELGNRIAAELGLEPEWSTESSFGAIVPSVQNGRVDAALESININPERLQAVSFVSYISTFDTLVVPAGNPGDVDPANLCGSTLSMATGGATNPLLEEYSQECVAQGEEPIELQEYGTTDAMVLAVQNGRAQGMSIGSAVALVRVEQSGGALESEGPVTVLGSGDLMRSANAGVVIGKQSTGLGEAIQTVIADLQADGSFLELLQEYGFDETAVVPAEFVQE